MPAWERMSPGTLGHDGCTGCGMHILRSLFLNLLASLWFVPSVLVLIAVVAGLVLVELHPYIGLHLAEEWPRLFGAGAEGARGMLSAIATSMITVAGVVFSITIVALSLTASQYSPRVLRNFMSDRPTQFVLGAFVAVFAYCLIVLRTIRGSDEGTFVPSLAVLGGVVMAFVGIGLLIFFVHHVATAIQVDYIVQRIAVATREAIDRLFPSGVGEDRLLRDKGTPAVQVDMLWEDVPAPRTGYLVAIDATALMQFATKHQAVVRLRKRVGEFIVAPMAVAQIAGGTCRPDDGWTAALSSYLTVQGERNIHQDAAFGLQQLVDVGLRALSPGVHDPTTAVSCIDHLASLLHHLSSRHFGTDARECDGHVRLIVQSPNYEDYIEVALSALTHHAGSHAPVHARLLVAIETAAAATDDPKRLGVLVRALQTHAARLANADLPIGTAEALRHRASAMSASLQRKIDRYELIHGDCSPDGTGLARNDGTPEHETSDSPPDCLGTQSSRHP